MPSDVFPLLSPPVPQALGPAVKISGGRYNGLIGNVAKHCDTFCSVVIEFEHRWFEIVIEARWLAPLAQPASA